MKKTPDIGMCFHPAALLPWRTVRKQREHTAPAPGKSLEDLWLPEMDFHRPGQMSGTVLLGWFSDPTSAVPERDHHSVRFAAICGARTAI
jgi:hypothetical protein